MGRQVSLATPLGGLELPWLSGRAVCENRTASPLCNPLRLFKTDTIDWRFIWFQECKAGIEIRLGHMGEDSARQVVPRNDWTTLRRDITRLVSDGYSELADDAWRTMSIVYGTDGPIFSKEDVFRMRTLSDLIDQALFRTGQGFALTPEFGPGMMKARYRVVDTDAAFSTSLATLNGSGHGDYLAVEIDESPQPATPR